MKFDKLRQDKGVGGLTILLSLVTMLFVIGFLVMIFSLMGGEMSDATYTSTTGTSSNETLTTVSELGEDFAVVDYRNVVCGAVSLVLNATDNVTISSGNYTQTNCNIAFDDGDANFNNTNWLVTYSYTYDANNTATEVISETTAGISGVTDWYTIFIVVTAMIILILLIEIIITAIGGSGLLGVSTQNAGNVGIA